MKRQRKDTIRDSRGDRIFNYINTLVMILIIAIVAYPLIFVVSASVSSPAAVNGGQVILFPKDITWEGYKRIFQYKPLWTGYLNSILYTVVGTVVNLLFTIPAGYALSRKQLCGRRPLLFLFSFTMFFGGGMVPTYMVVKNLGLLNSMWALILPGACSVYNIIVTKTFLEVNIPQELIDASRIDGCSDFTTFSDVVLPLSKPIVAIMTMFYAIGHWNSYFDALLYIDNKDKFPLQLVLRELLTQNQTGSAMGSGAMASLAEKAQLAEQMKYGIIIVSSIPMLLMFPFVIKYFKKGVMIGSIKS